MLEDIKTFYSNNTTIVILAAVALIAMLGLFMFKSSLFKKPNTSMDMAMGGMEEMGGMRGMEEMNDMGGMGEMCDPSSGMCNPHAMMNMSPPMNDSTNNESNSEPNDESNGEFNNDFSNNESNNYEQ